MRILVCDGLHESGLELLRGTEGIEVDAPDVGSGLGSDQWPMETIREKLHEYDAMIVRSRTKVTQDMLNNAVRLKVIGRAGTGVDNIDVSAASARGVLVMNTPGANATAAAEHTLAMMLALARHIPQANQSMREGRWEKKRFMGTELGQQTLGIIGLGRIGSIVADRALGMGMEVLAYDPYISAEAAAAHGIALASLDELLQRSHFITLHTPLSRDTEHIINREAIAKMRPGVRIINCARGGLIDEEALYAALKEGRVGGAALDVFEIEPPRDNPLLSLDNVISTPHLGASSIQAQATVARTIASQLIDYLLHGLIRNAVNFPSVSPKAHERLRPYMSLGESLGSLQGQLCTAIERLEIEYSGPELQELPLQPITQMVAKGLLEPILSEQVNLVNAPIMLGQRRIQLVASRTSEPRGYTGMITVRVTGKGQTSSVAGTVFPVEGARLIRVNDYWLEAELRGVNLLIQNLDKPGTIGFIGTTLGNHQVNIANMHLSRTPARDKAIAIIRVDDEATEEALTALRNHPNILSVQQVRL